MVHNNVEYSKKETQKIYRNNRNENKYISVKHWNDGHYGVMQFMKWGDIINPTGCTLRSNGKHHRYTKKSLELLLEDYTKIGIDEIKDFEAVYNKKQGVKM